MIGKPKWIEANANIFFLAFVSSWKLVHFFSFIKINEGEKESSFFSAIIIEMDQFLLFKNANLEDKLSFSNISIIFQEMDCLLQAHFIGS